MKRWTIRVGDVREIAEQLEAECRTGLGGEMATDDDGNDRDRFSKVARNHHPTVKPLALCEYLARLILPPKRDTPRRLLVPFSGSGSEMIGALLAGWDEVVGIEISEDYAAIAEARLRHWTASRDWRAELERKPTQAEDFGPLFAGGKA